jgi:hypothetical protein
MSKYIFMTGAPGSKWSSVCKNIYYSDSIDRSDYSDARTYYHDASGTLQLMHLGAYFDPYNEFGYYFTDWHLFMDRRENFETEFDKPFTGSGVRIIKSHYFAHKIDYLKTMFPEVPIVLVHRNNDSCLGWWVRCGFFTITYPSYAKYYKDLKQMGKEIDRQNADILTAWDKYKATQVNTNVELATHLGIQVPNEQYYQNYKDHDITVGVI